MKFQILQSLSWLFSGKKHTELHLHVSKLDQDGAKFNSPDRESHFTKYGKLK